MSVQVSPPTQQNHRVSQVAQQSSRATQSIVQPPHVSVQVLPQNVSNQVSPPTQQLHRASQVSQQSPRHNQSIVQPQQQVVQSPQTIEKDKLLSKFHRDLKKVDLELCRVCHEAYKTNVIATSDATKKCPTCRQRHSSDKYRDMIESMQPCLFPAELKDYKLTFLEEQLIAMVCVNQYVYVRRMGAIATIGKKCFFFLI